MTKEQSGLTRNRRLDIVFRCCADALMFNAAILAGLVSSFLIRQTPLKASNSAPAFSELLGRYLPWSPLFTALALTIFYLFGFYTRGRAYRSKYKALYVAQAVTVVFLILAAATYFDADAAVLPRTTLVTSWVVAVAMLTGARVWSAIWKSMLDRERAQETEAVSATAPPLILVIGGAGYVGSALLPKLLDKGYRVRLFDLFMYGEEPVANLMEHERLEVLRGDFRQLDKIVKSMDGVDAVIHLGAIVGDPACALDEEFTIEVNLTATRMIAEVAKARGIKRFIFASTCSVYGASDEILDERSALNPVSLYARSKIASEKVLGNLNSERFATTILRFGTVYGLSGRTRFDLVVNLLTAKAVVDSKITVFGADQWRPFVHVDDTASAVLAVLEAPVDVVRGQIFNVGSEEQNKTLGELGAMIQRQVPTAECICSLGDSDRRNYRVRFTKISQRIGYKPKWTLEAGISQVIQAFQDGRVTDYRDDKYSNVQFLKNEEGQKYLTTDVAWLKSLIENSYSEQQLPSTQDQVTVR
ncbi:MAG: NAD-dependent epimerase/dehydratase [Fimbriimonas sp.]|nr:NAD-dependent epimerase/dehydratase [Fimbriimonas sp.]